ncbi:hypothetical protein Pst134EA_027722 [Puccinia striiformis f. sp. tritici]|nr:hypothetical protein Pst134EA_027722 [Puccinia striiformis f. sp. tritici]KAH9448411.1 hypothetical protein Pst134EA_027722 [Puccinia striiformis f. sp. tritici]KAI9625219.1 hypothetical protein H4Q26_016410 [Puccinia striiformis f. sp. tritici PST-130]
MTWHAESLLQPSALSPSDSSMKFFVEMSSRFVLLILIASACCMEFTPKLEVEGSNPIALDDLVSSASSKKRKSTFIDRDPSALKRPNFFPLKDKDPFGRSLLKKQNTSAEAEYLCRKEFTDLIKDSPLKDLHPKKRFILLRSWERNSDQVLSLAADLEEILNQQKWEELLLDSGAEDQNGEVGRLSESSRVLCGKIRDALNILKEKRLLQLGGLNSPQFQDVRTFALLKLNHHTDSQMAKQIEGYPPDIVHDIVKKTWEKLSCSILDNIQQIIINQKSLPKHQKPGQYTTLVPAVSYQFKTMDFLYKQGFINKEAVRRYVFHDKESVMNLITYVHGGFNSEKFISKNKQEMWIGNESIINHWYFPLMHKMFEAFGEKEQHIIRLYCIESKILISSYRLEHAHYISKELQEKLASFSVEGYIDQLTQILNGSYQSMESGEKRIIRIELSVKERNQMKLEIAKMIQLLHDLNLNSSSDKETDFERPLFYVSVCHLLDFTERNICKGIVEETEAETIPNGFVTSTTLRKASRSSSTLGEFLDSTDNLLCLLNDEESQSYLKKNEIYLRQTIDYHIRQLSIKVNELKKWYGIVGNNRIIYGSLCSAVSNLMIFYTNIKIPMLKACATRCWKE